MAIIFFFLFLPYPPSGFLGRFFRPFLKCLTFLRPRETNGHVSPIPPPVWNEQVFRSAPPLLLNSCFPLLGESDDSCSRRQHSSRAPLAYLLPPALTVPVLFRPGCLDQGPSHEQSPVKSFPPLAFKLKSSGPGDGPCLGTSWSHADPLGLDRLWPDYLTNLSPALKTSPRKNKPTRLRLGGK